MKTRASLAFLLLFAVRSTICLAGPFGFDPGMSKTDIIKLVGRSAVVEEKDDILVLSTAPKPHGAFEKYICTISPEMGLLKVTAVGKDINTSGPGEEVQTAFKEMLGALTQNYGNPDNVYDFLHVGSIWSDYQDWMMALLKDERSLAAYWKPDPIGAHITSILLEADAESHEKGYLTLGYEFEGFEKYSDQKKANQDKVL